MRTPASALTTDLYELTMAAGYWREKREERATFELFVRHLPPRRGYLLSAGLEDAIEYLESLHFTPEEIAYLRSLPTFAGTPSGFFEMLEGLTFTGDLWAVPEGAPVFANEPILVVSAPVIEAQIVETALLALTNYPTSVATKAARVVEAARGRAIVEFGSRRAPGPDAALTAARAAFIGGCIGTSNVQAGMEYDIPVYGTIAHSWVTSFEDEVDSFRSYQQAFPNNTVPLIDTYDTLRAARRIVKAFSPPEVAGVRLDSGDLNEVSREVRAILDSSGFAKTKIMASGDLNEEAIRDLVADGAPIDIFGVGTDLTTVRDAPALGGVYKLVEMTLNDSVEYKIKLSEDKTTYPGHKQIHRTIQDGLFAGDIVTLLGEPEPANSFPVLTQVIKDGKRCSQKRALTEIQSSARLALDQLPANIRAFDGPTAPYPVRFSPQSLAIQSALRRGMS